MHSDYVEENHKLLARIFDLENAITEHAQRTRTVGQSDVDIDLWKTIGLHVYTDAEKKTLQENALRMETEAQKRAEGLI